MKSFKVMAATAVLAFGGVMVMNANAESDRAGYPTVGNNSVSGEACGSAGTTSCNIDNSGITLTTTAGQVCGMISGALSLGGALNCR